MKFLIVSLLLVVLSGCVTPGSKYREAAELTASAEARGFIKGPQEAAKKAQKDKCEIPAELKWELNFTKETPLIEQPVGNGTNAYGPYHVLCFSGKETGDKKIKILTKYVSGGFSQAYFVLPYIYVFNSKLQAVKIPGKFDLKQEFLSGDYTIEGPLPVKKDEMYFLVVEADNRFPTKPWNQYANYGMGASAGLFPVKVHSSVVGKVKVEIDHP